MYKRETKFLLPSEYKKEKALLAVQEAEDGQSPFQASSGIGTELSLQLESSLQSLQCIGWVTNDYV